MPRHRKTTLFHMASRPKKMNPGVGCDDYIVPQCLYTVIVAHKRKPTARYVLKAHAPPANDRRSASVNSVKRRANVRAKHVHVRPVQAGGAVGVWLRPHYVCELERSLFANKSVAQLQSGVCHAVTCVDRADLRDEHTVRGDITRQEFEIPCASPRSHGQPPISNSTPSACTTSAGAASAGMPLTSPPMAL